MQSNKLRCPFVLFENEEHPRLCCLTHLLLRTIRAIRLFQLQGMVP